MRMSRSVLVAVIVSACGFAGCDSGGGGAGQTAEEVPLQPTNTAPFDGMKNQMLKDANVKSVPAPAPAPAPATKN
jgi:hypothetical protein